FPLGDPSTVSITGNSIDINKQVVITGEDVSGTQQTITLRVPASGHASDPTIFKSINSVVKDITQMPVSLWSNFELLSQYLPGETHPQYRLIKLNKPADEIKI